MFFKTWKDRWEESRMAERHAATIDYLHKPAQFQSILECERMRADRSSSVFTLVVFILKDRGAAQEDFARLASHLKPRIRITDHAGQMSERQLGVILWDTGESGAYQFVKSVMPHEELIPRPQIEVYVYPQNRSLSDVDRLLSDILDTTRELSGASQLSSAENVSGNKSQGMDGDGPHDSDGTEQNEKALSASGSVALELTGRSTRGQLRSDGNMLSVDTGGRIEIKRRPSGEAASSTTYMSSLSSYPSHSNAGLSETASTCIVVKRPLESLFVRPMPYWKRGCDLLLAGLALVVLSPVLFMIGLLVRLTSPGPAIFSQWRAGLGGKPFRIFKFRTMCVDAESQRASLLASSDQQGPAFKMVNDPRVTWFGRFLRKTSLDELPQLWNVVRGEMSLVGPRPLPLIEADQCQGWERRRLLVTPGLTCIWQIDGKSKVGFDEWMRMDIRYSKARTWWNDCRLIFRTFFALVTNRLSQH